MSRVQNLHKHPNSSTNVWSIYKRVGEFFDGVDLDGENWHSGMTRLRNNGNLKHRSSYREDAIRDDELADAVYLRSGDKEKAFGVITNRRANYHTLGDDSCHLNLPAPEHSDDSDIDILLQTYDKVTPGNLNNRLRIRNMAGGGVLDGVIDILQEYKIKYYSPYDQVNSIKEETRWSPNLTLDFPDLDTLDIILFEVFRMGENFKSMQNDTTNSEGVSSRETKIEKNDDVSIYPNPNNWSFVVIIEEPSDVKEIRIIDNLGKKIDAEYQILHKNKYDMKSLRSGVYIVEVIFEDKVIRKKIVIN